MKKFLLSGDTDDEPIDPDQEDPFGNDKIQESSDTDSGGDGDGEIPDLSPLPITVWRRFFPSR